MTPDEVGIQGGLDVRTLASKRPHHMEIRAANAAKVRQDTGIPAHNPQQVDAPEQFMPLVHYIYGPMGNQAAQLLVTLTPHGCNTLFGKNPWDVGTMWKAKQMYCHMLVHVHLSSMDAVCACAVGLPAGKKMSMSLPRD